MCTIHTINKAIGICYMNSRDIYIVNEIEKKKNRLESNRYSGTFPQPKHCPRKLTKTAMTSFKTRKQNV